MRNVLIIIGVFFSLLVYGQNTVTYGYDSVGNRISRTAAGRDVAPVSSRESANIVWRKGPRLPLLFHDGSFVAMTAPQGTPGNMADASLASFWSQEYSWFLLPKGIGSTRAGLFPPFLEEKEEATKVTN